MKTLQGAIITYISYDHVTEPFNMRELEKLSVVFRFINNFDHPCVGEINLFNHTRRPNFYYR